MHKSKENINNSIVGLHFGDEGKGKFTDYLSNEHSLVVRYNGGNNAGHTIVSENKIFKLNLLPSGILNPNNVCLIGNGCVIDSEHLLNEIARLKKNGCQINPDRLKISLKCPLVLQLHKDLDRVREEKSADEKKIGTTLKGIGPAYEDKVGRRALFICDLQSKNLVEKKLQILADYHNVYRAYYKLEMLTLKKLKEEISQYETELLSYAVDTFSFINEYAEKGKKILFEGCQGVLLDICFGTYPYVTSSNTVPASAYLGTGLSLKHRMNNIGVTKTYMTRVGSGPFITEIHGEIANHICEKGNEIGTVTQRKRRTGWFDAICSKYAVSVAGINELILTKLDVLDELDEIKICVGYKLNGEIIHHYPSSFEEITTLKPIYETVPGWKTSTRGLTSWEKLPRNAQKYIKIIEEKTGVNITIISTGPDRNQTVDLRNYQKIKKNYNES